MPDPTPAPTVPEPSVSLLVLCVECGDGMEVPLPVDPRLFSFRLAQNGWFPQVVTPPEQAQMAGRPVVLAALCTVCAKKAYTPELYKTLEERRTALVQAAQTAQGSR